MEVATGKGTYPKNYVVVVTTLCAQMMMLVHCLPYVREHLHLGRPIVQMIATLDRFQGRQSQVIFRFFGDSRSRDNDRYI